MIPTIQKDDEGNLVDPVMAEVRQAKLDLIKKFNYDLGAMIRDARVRQEQSGRLIVDRSI